MIDGTAENNSPDEGVVRLALVTCGPQLEVALACPSSEAVSLVRLGGVAPRSTLVMAAVDLLVEDAGMPPEGVREIIVSRGPGSFTGIRAGLATAAGLVAAVGAELLAFDSLTMLAARCDGEGEVWSAQPGRRGEVYARRFELVEDGPPRALTEIEILPVSALKDRCPWVTAEALGLGAVPRAKPVRSSAEALLRLVEIGAPTDPPEPLYVEGPPIHSKTEKG